MADPTLDYLIRCADERTFGAHGPDDADCAALAAHLRRLRDVERACEDAAPDNIPEKVGADACDPDEPRYVIQGEDGEPMIATDSPAELVTTLFKWAGALSDHAEDRERRLRALDAAVRRVRELHEANSDGECGHCFDGNGLALAPCATLRALDAGGGA
jgi:hypothetical protein